MVQKDINYYLNLNYTTKFRRIDNDPNYPEGYYFGWYEELDGCHTDAPTVEKLLIELEEVKRTWLEIKLEHAFSIPEPSNSVSRKSEMLEMLNLIVSKLDNLDTKINGLGEELKDFRNEQEQVNSHLMEDITHRLELQSINAKINEIDSRIKQSERRVTLAEIMDLLNEAKKNA